MGQRCRTKAGILLLQYHLHDGRILGSCSHAGLQMDLAFATVNLKKLRRISFLKT